MMSILEQRTLKHDMNRAQQQLTHAAQLHGKTSPEYRAALTRFVRLWSILRMTRSQTEFFPEVQTTQAV